MQINYKNNRVKKQCSDIRIAKKNFPEKIAMKLLKLINFIDAAENLESLINNPIYNFHALKGNMAGFYAMDIDGRSKPYRLIVSFDDMNTGQVFSDAISIFEILIEEVSKHYE